METPLSSRRITRSLAAAASALSTRSWMCFLTTPTFDSPQRRAPPPRWTPPPSSPGSRRPPRWRPRSRRAPPCTTSATTPHRRPRGGRPPRHRHHPAKTRRRAPRRTPGTGEALLRGQVKALLHNVEEEQGAAAAALVRPARIQALLGVSRSPAQLLAPTPANTPQIGPVSAPREGLLLLDGAAVVPCVLDEEELLIPKLQLATAFGPKVLCCSRCCAGHCSFPASASARGEAGRVPAEPCAGVRRLPEKSDESNGSAVSSSVSLQESSTGSYMDKSSSSPEDDSSSAWSIQVHASSEKGDEEELGVEKLAAAEYTEEEEEEEDWEEDSDDDCYDDLCEEMSRMTVLGEEEKKAGLSQFEGKHTRFIYNSDDEIECEEVADAAEARAELGALMLRALPVPEGRHLRFHDEEDDEE
ncbi:unnamed protein product [Miscanthus lutarioriparius]|uniref:Uncharacterized protein n=1 Tax=Miscanthus lutarioriparius TaxID=422564 RepID=A0A811MC08_9POAL|nr:unnamed protein product [Miscanthus lutarioriparius]